MKENLIRISMAGLKSMNSNEELDASTVNLLFRRILTTPKKKENKKKKNGYAPTSFILKLYAMTVV